MLLLLGWSCWDVAVESAFWAVPALWPTPCSPAPDCAWLTPCAVLAALRAAEPAAGELVGGAAPEVPGLKIRTEMLLLLGLVWVEVALELADWPVPADCWTPWTDCA